MKRGEVWWADLRPPSGVRPVVLLSRDEVYQKRAYVTVAPVTRTARPIRSHVKVDVEDGFRVPSVVNLDDIQTIPKGNLIRLLTALSAGNMNEVNGAIQFALGL